MVDAKDLSISAGSDPKQVLEEASSLIDSGNWSLCLEGKGLERSSKFKGFKATWDFMNDVAVQCKKQKHHPEWTNIYNQTRIRWTTHNPEGLSVQDTLMAKYCDESAQRFGEIVAESQSMQSTQGQDEWEKSARDCCSAPRKS